MIFEKLIDKVGEIGFVTQIIDTIVYASGIPGAKPDEIIVFESGETGQVLSVLSDEVEILTFSNKKLKVGTRLTRKNSTLKIPIDENMLGKIIDPLGNLLEGKKTAEKINSFPVNTEPLGITQRKGIKKYLETGVSMVDLMIPLGKGQRELVVGDRKTGKTSFLLNTILTQAKQGNICIYACIGKRKIDIKKAQEFFIKNKITDNVLIIASTSTDPAGVIYITPYSAMAAAEYFRDKEKDVLVVLDDMSTHAKFYREISLLGKRFPGRNSYPGDIFYIHAKLIERAGNFFTKSGERAITCIPVVETTQGDLSGYIQTNLMSMTDGHLFFDSNLFYQGQRPSINPFLSVTRVGRQTQSDIKRSLNRELTTFLTLYEKVQNFVHFGSELNDSAKVTLETGAKIMKLFEQPSGKLIPSNVQVITLTLFWKNFLNDNSIDAIVEKRDKMIELYEKDKNFRDKLDLLLNNASSLNDLLNKIKNDGPFVSKLIEL